MTNARHLVSRNKREGWYAGFEDRHFRSNFKFFSLKVKTPDFFKAYVLERASS